MAEKNFKKEILNWIGGRINSSNEFFLPLKKLRKELTEDLSFSIPPLEELRKWLKEDGRFDIMDIPGGLGRYPVTKEADMEQMGFFKGSRIGLKSKRPSLPQIIDKLQGHTEKLIQSLQQAYATRPKEGEDSGEVEDQLLELLQRAQRLKEEVTKILKGNRG